LAIQRWCAEPGDERRGARGGGEVESQNPLASVKDRIGFTDYADASGRPHSSRKTVLIDPNPTAATLEYALALCGGGQSYKLILTMPETMSLERVCCCLRWRRDRSYAGRV